VKGDGSGDRTRSSDPGLLERDRHPCPGEACTARSQRHQARRGERRQPDEGRSDRVVDLQRVQDGCPARDAAGGGKRRPGEDGRAEPERANRCRPPAIGTTSTSGANSSECAADAAVCVDAGRRERADPG
jgi:hypothetical protein